MSTSAPVPSAPQSAPILQTANPQLSPASSTISESEPASVSSPAPAGFLGHVRSVLSDFGHDIVQAGGQAPPQYQADASGDIQRIASAAAPGQLFKNLLTGALMGLGAAAQHPRGGPLGAAGSGFTAAMGNAQQENQEARAQAVQQAELKQRAQQESLEQQKFELERQSFNANVAHWNVENLRQQHIAALQDQDHLEQQNDINNSALDKALESGGRTIPIKNANGDDINGQTGNSAALMKWYSTPGNQKSPSGGTLKLITNYDTAAMKEDGVHYDVDSGFYKDGSGNRADLDKYITNTVVDVPPSAMNQIVNVPKSEMLRFGVKTVAATTPMTLAQYMGFAQREQELSFRQSEAQYQRDLTLLNGVENQVTSLSAQRDKILTDPNNAQIFAQGGAKAHALTADIDKQIAGLSQTANKIMNRYGIAPPAPNQAAGESQPLSGSIPAGALIARNPQTGEVAYSTDGGKTWTKNGAAASSPSDRVIVRRGDGSTYTTTRADYDDAASHPNPAMSDRENRYSLGTILGLAPPPAPPKTAQQQLGELKLTAGSE